jgi:hypothetical protein
MFAQGLRIKLYGYLVIPHLMRDLDIVRRSRIFAVQIPG